MNNNTPLAKRFKESPPEKYSDDVIYRAIYRNKSLEELRELLNNIPDDQKQRIVNYTDYKHFTPLIYLLISPDIYYSNADRINIIKLLVENGADVNITIRDGVWQTDVNTALMKAVTHNNSTNIIKLLLDYGANINTTDIYGRTALMYAAKSYYNRPEIIKLLLDYGANINATDIYGQTALMGADNNPEIIKLFLDYGANINATDKKGETVLIQKIISYKLNTVKELLKHPGIDIDHQDKRGRSALIWCVLNFAEDDIIIPKLLLKKGAKVDLTDRKGNTVLILAAREGYYKVVDLLLKHGANIDIKNKDGKTALDLAKDATIVNIIKKYIRLGEELHFLSVVITERRERREQFPSEGIDMIAQNIFDSIFGVTPKYTVRHYTPDDNPNKIKFTITRNNVT